jgi:transposase
VLDGASRAEAAKIGGMDRQTLRDRVIRFNDQGRGGLINTPSRGCSAQARCHAPGVSRQDRGGRSDPGSPWRGRWRACDLIMRLHEEFGISVSDDTIYRALKEVDLSPTFSSENG